VRLPPFPHGARIDVLCDVSLERVRQDEKWGGTPGIDRISGPHYPAVLGEEFGEVCKAVLEGQTAELRTELIHVAAVAVAWVEELDNLAPKDR
jgi:hypothetical protein